MQCVNSETWDLTDLEDIDVLIASWLNYGRKIYYRYELEAEAITCVTRGIWKIARDHIVEQSRLNPESSTSEILEGFNNNESIVEQNMTIKTQRRKRSAKESAANERTVGESGLASLLGITSKQFSQDYSRSVVRAKKSVDRTWEDDVKLGDLERAILKTLVKSNPLFNVLLNFLGNVVYLIHSINAFMKSSIVLTCLSDYAVARGSEFMYMNI
ncbi:hypothetical protein PV325_000025 [Microctonus aethiopoides]|uniref:Uncharacterized protein n=1 Tax=Microctonus aethiopoides TaxID=144406 RepID=A0AA39EZP6_9HYME|nr:hypothetical protein PV325_000025 [Microctonus aethiopoides]KAK0095693.1 hypothetical protein PV326_007643 [Microctonus aethiopoides]KAK0158791.1 hypothetical protein PV328_009744 [Microctonus aethiopoides]